MHNIYTGFGSNDIFESQESSRRQLRLAEGFIYIGSKVLYLLFEE